MQINFSLKLISALLLTFILSGCGGADGGSTLDNLIDKTSSAPAGTTSTPSSSAPGADILQSIEFKDANPAIINLKGTGGTESSQVRFRTLGQTGGPIKGVKVNFVLSSVVGGVQLSQTSGTSDKDGYVSTSVTSGTVSISFRVTATVVSDPSISTQSSQLVVNTGLPDQKSFSLALEKFNPAGGGHNGITSQVSVILSDAYNNAAADGTAVSFTTEGGSIEGSCTTDKGKCQVQWTSADPRPPRRSNDNSISRVLCLGMTSPSALYTCQAERAGRSTILATAVGNESFKDTNGNGIYDFGTDGFAKSNSNNSNCLANVPVSSYETFDLNLACDDLPEAYLDENESGTRNLVNALDPNSIENFVDFITGDDYTAANGVYDGAFCPPSAPATQCTRKSVTIRKEHMVVMSCDYPLLDANGKLPKLPTPEFLANSYAVADCNGNALPIGTKITIGSTNITVGNQYDWTQISAAPNTDVKIKNDSIDQTYTTAP